ncbi:hypothetical protein MASR1M31_21550 [Porphyromonadaceae bacterium]
MPQKKLMHDTCEVDNVASIKRLLLAYSLVRNNKIAETKVDDICEDIFDLSYGWH